MTLVKWCYSAGKSVFGVAPAIVQILVISDGFLPIDHTSITSRKGARAGLMQNPVRFFE